MSYKLTVKPDPKVMLWAIHIDARPVVGFNRDGETLVTLANGVHRLVYDVRGPGGTFTIDIAEQPRIVQPAGARWPFKVEVPDDRSFELDALYFETEQ